MKSVAAAILLWAFCATGSAAQPGEGDCSSEFIHDFTGAQRCTSHGVCTAHRPVTIEFAGVLTCGAPWGDLFRICFANGNCVDGKATFRSTLDGDKLYTSILKNPQRLGGYPDKFSATLSLSSFGNFPDQLVLFLPGTDPQTELLFGEKAVASFVAQARKGKHKQNLARFLKKPAAVADFKE